MARKRNIQNKKIEIENIKIYIFNISQASTPKQHKARKTRLQLSSIAMQR